MTELFDSNDIRPDNAQSLDWRNTVYLPVPRAGEIVGLSPATLYKLQRDGRLEFRRLGGRTLVTTESLGALIDSAEPWQPSPAGRAARAASVASKR